MLRWRQYLEMLRADGVHLETSEYEVLTETGERLTTQFLLRWVDGAALTYPVEITDQNEPVPRRTMRQVAVALRLPPEKYVFPKDMN